MGNEVDTTIVSCAVYQKMKKHQKKKNNNNKCFYPTYSHERISPLRYSIVFNSILRRFKTRENFCFFFFFRLLKEIEHSYANLLDKIARLTVLNEDRLD